MPKLTDFRPCLPARLVRRTSAVLAVATLAAAAFAHAASADPVNARSTTFPATCDGTAVEFANNGNGDFSAAHVIGGSAVFVVHSSTVTFEITPAVGTPETVTQTASKPHPHGELVTCDFDVTEISEEGTVHVFGSATGVFTPARRTSA